MGDTYRTVVNNQTIHLKEGRFGFRVIYPWKIDGKRVWKNILFGGYGNLIRLLFYLLIVMLLYLGIYELIEKYQYIAQNPCQFCPDFFKGIP